MCLALLKESSCYVVCVDYSSLRMWTSRILCSMLFVLSCSRNRATNLELCQSNMTYLTGKKGTGCHWLLDLFERLKLPILDGMQEALEQANKNRKKKLEKLRYEKSK